ncbi:MAG: hypothetical protein EZS28_001599 [Streblomastix strix]|uniref:Uncharacterized protein n=1 Tax=Streblomastix strix TaxID=222440 RepID=A0A5J4X6S0_9EUKA|nr:MAG: hypothetical protein EZS28_001599 [Streblomastix strix]
MPYHRVAADGPCHRISITTKIKHLVRIESFNYKIIDKIKVPIFAIIQREIRRIDASVAVAALISPATLQRCMTCDNPPVIPEPRFYVIYKMTPVVVNSIQCWRNFDCELCLAYAASCRQKQFSVERSIGFFDVVA